MRIAILANAASPHTRRWAGAFRDRGHEVHVLSIRRGDIPGVTCHRIGVGSAAARAPWWALLSYLRLLASARRRLRRIDPDVVHAHYSVTHGSIAVISRVRPVVVTLWGSDILRGDRPVGPFGRAVNRFVLRRSDAVTSASDMMRLIAARIAGGDHAFDTVPFGVDTAVFRPDDDQPDRPFTVGFVKRFEHRYGFDTLLRAFARVLAEIPDARLVMAGGGSRRRMARRMAGSLGVADAVEMAGVVPHSEVPDLIRRLDVLVNPSRSESFGVVALEAAACEVPVVATRVGGITETVRHDETGLLVPVDDPDALTDALIALARDPARRRALGEAGRAFVAERFEWESTVDRMLAVLERVAVR